MSIYLKNRNMFRLAVPIIAIGSLGALQPATAQVVVGGTNAPTVTPFGGDAPFATTSNYSGEYQQIYSASAFTTPVSISQIAFSSIQDSSGFFSNPETASYNFTIGISNTSATVTNPSTVYANNIGTNFITVFTGPLTANLKANNTFDLVIPFSTSFVYNPGLAGQQNLLLDVIINSANVPITTDEFQAGSSTLTANVFNSAGVAGSPARAETGGLLTRFTVSPAPEPSSTLVLLLGFGSVLLACKRRSIRN